MLTESNPQTEEYDIPDFNADSIIRQEIEQMRLEIEKIKDRLEGFEEKLTACSSGPSTPKNDVANILIGPISKTVKNSSSKSNTDSKVKQKNSDVPPALGENEINKFFGEYVKCSEVDSIKKQLEEKLRHAEVEMSIQRARVFQQKAELEEMKMQLEEREAAIRKSVEDQQTSGDSTKRWDRHFEFFRKK